MSYVWGEKKLHPDKVVINGRTCQVLESIHPILILISDEPGVKKDVWFWIDYLCINQDDDLERAAQVALMGTLYQRAFRTLVWFCEATPDVRGAVDLLKIFASDSSKSRDQTIWASHDLVSPEKWQALRHWMRRPWDRVYADLGICNDTDRAIVGTPDYTLSVKELYIRLAMLDGCCFSARALCGKRAEPTSLAQHFHHLRTV
ncbi:hypothetical protein INS49_014265 [Diaporthe citri]|uniref:uncharacterized protein n=1 Tax=Diaporthe citri TaxID=83186 RepID=UPI001C8153CA|nr:uncharacterized protein INS49_014265 [Diaporthe citri]KAG6358381.1 hypothetical protein INS49_014265 [Diaporthe citri]